MINKLIRLLGKQKTQNKFQRLEITLPETQLLSWLANQSFEQKVYWHDRKSGIEIAGIGCSDCIHTIDSADYFKVFSTIKDKLSPEFPAMRYYGGFNFSRETEHDEYWQSFGNNLFILPRFEIVRIKNSYTLAMNFLAENKNDLIELRKEIEQIVESGVEFIDEMPYLINFDHYPDKNGWDAMIESALSEIKHQDFEKIVLARKTRLQFSDKPDGFQILENLKNLNPDSTHFCIQPNMNSSFIGGTPELLYRRTDANIFSVAIAGTRKRGINEIEDEQLEDELLTSEKDLREHQIVVDNVREIMQDLCSEVDGDDTISVLKLARVQHLYTAFEGQLRQQSSDIEIISRLHPTPAVGGYPTEIALPEISRLEPFKRGWYAAPVGWISGNAAHFVVAIRSGLIHNRDLYLYSGAGIVTGSDADLEWEEVENKLANFLRAVNVNGEMSDTATENSPEVQTRQA